MRGEVLPPVAGRRPPRPGARRVIQAVCPMKLNGRFGRLESRYRKGYEKMRETLCQAGVETPKVTREPMRQTWRRAVIVFPAGLPIVAVAIPGQGEFIGREKLPPIYVIPGPLR